MKKERGIRISVVGKPWVVWFVAKSDLHRKYGSDTVAIAEVEDREIFLKGKRLRLEAVIHELVHAYLWEMGLNSMPKVKPAQLEELFCELMANFGARILAQADRVMKRAGE